MRDPVQERQADQDAAHICTIGYGARELDAFLDLLRAESIEYLLDVRSAPYSSCRPEFSSGSLDKAVRLAGIHYLYLGCELGVQPDEPSCYLDGKVDYTAVRRLPRFQEGIERLKRAYCQGQRVALMCSEGKPELCHRSELIGEVLRD